MVANSFSYFFLYHLQQNEISLVNIQLYILLKIDELFRSRFLLKVSYVTGNKLRGNEDELNIS